MWKSDHVILLETDSYDYGGFNRLEPAVKKIFYQTKEYKCNNRDYSIQLYLPNRSALVLCAKENLGDYSLVEEVKPKIVEEVKPKIKVQSIN